MTAMRGAMMSLLLLGVACTGPSTTDRGPIGPSDGGPLPDQRRAEAAPAPDRPAADLSQNARCIKLATRYRDLLKQAKSCMLQAGPQCAKLVDDWVGCGCLTSVEASHDKVLAEMSQVAAEWIALSCQLTCPRPACTTQPKGSCVAGAEGTRCEDQSR